ncbi:lipoyl(octanoyl) transferase LipB [Microbacterium oleivorans]|uniref:Octanoyltransferase n=1 Tax=Microbacterium oleivorans TaxID=273677 RepID=A0A7D5F6I2_9MICO|nr:lipoyl(octanoyl) transferase LipB [Microbacterium oleivorans]QLD10349.1 lipoyl(octanoyl) transferase LipB [Microbacterium oleivorans]
MIDVRIVGLAPDVVPYTQGWELQRRTHAAVVGGAADTLLLLEHEAVYTAGVRTAAHERPDDATPVIDVDRGGKITWHGPGQLVGYPIVRLATPVDVVAHVRRLESVLIAVLGELGIDSRRVVGRSGVWVSQGGRDAKVAAIGVRVERGVTMHGFAVNCSNDLAPFSRIVPCGITDADVTSLSSILGRTLAPRDAVDAIARGFAAAFSDASDAVVAA